MSWDVIIIGLGAMGSAAAFHLADRGLRVLGLDRFRPPHNFGSSHGQTRIIREAYFEGPAYVPLVQHAYNLWEKLEQQVGTRLFLKTGGLMLGRPESIVVSGARKSAETYHLPHEILSASEVTSRFPAIRPASDMIGVLEPRAGILFPERCIAAHLQMAQERGAELRFDEQVARIELADSGVRVISNRDEFSGSQIVLSCGSWLSSLVPELHLSLVVERQIQFWFTTSKPEIFQPQRCPIHLWEHVPGRFFYGFPDLGNGAKVAGHHEGRIINPDHIDRNVSREEVGAMQKAVKPFLPNLDGPCLSSAVCMYTNTPDGHFLIDFHPDCDRVLLVSPCSGHGFKFSAAIGSVVADLITTRKTTFDLTPFHFR